MACDGSDRSAQYDYHCKWIGGINYDLASTLNVVFVLHFRHICTRRRLHQSAKHCGQIVANGINRLEVKHIAFAIPTRLYIHGNGSYANSWQNGPPH